MTSLLWWCPVTRTAQFSKDRRYRYRLTIKWDEQLPMCNFIMLNPSTADEVNNDPTVERCQRRAKMMGYGSLVVTNLFALRSTDPSYLRSDPWPISESQNPDLNDVHIMSSAIEASLIVCGWGKDGVYLDRSTDIVSCLYSHNLELHYLKMGKTGEPYHPLYLPYSLRPTLWQ